MTSNAATDLLILFDVPGISWLSQGVPSGAKAHQA